MTVYRKDLTANRVRALVDYDARTGVFIWRLQADARTPPEKRWNRLFAGRVAGTTDRRGYLRIKVRGTYYGGHRLAWLWMTGDWPPEDIDHVNKNPSDNRFCNLRLASRSQNQANVSAKSHNKLGLKGVCRRTLPGYTKPYHAQIKKDGKVRSLGHYASAEEAHEAYVRAAKDTHGEFWRST